MQYDLDQFKPTLDTLGCDDHLELTQKIQDLSDLHTEEVQAQEKYIKVWSFYDAPEYLRKLSTNGGDEDWLAIVPPHLVDRYIGWLEEGSSFGCYCVDEYDHPSLPGYKVKIGAHS